VGGVGAGEPQPALLHGVLGLAARAEHPVGQLRECAMRFEPACQVVSPVHPRSPFPVRACRYLATRAGLRDTVVGYAAAVIVVGLVALVVRGRARSAHDLGVRR
jgi:hypothetical protein